MPRDRWHWSGIVRELEAHHGRIDCEILRLSGGGFEAEGCLGKGSRMKKDTTAYTAPVDWDKNDCSIRALAVACGVPYAVASVAFSVTGRRVKGATELDITSKLHEEFLDMTRVRSAEGMDLETFCLVAPKGAYVVHKKGHAFAVIDGIVHDWESTTKPSTMVLRVWRVTERARAKMEMLKGLV